MIKKVYGQYLQGNESAISFANSVTLDSLLRVSESKYEYVTFQTFFLSLLVEEKDEQDFTHNTNIAF